MNGGSIAVGAPGLVLNLNTVPSSSGAAISLDLVVESNVLSGSSPFVNSQLLGLRCQ